MREGTSYANSASFPQPGIDSCPKAFGQRWQRASDEVARKGFTRCDDPAIQNVAAASNENWVKESADRQKSRDHCLRNRLRFQIYGPGCPYVLKIRCDALSGNRDESFLNSATSSATRPRIETGLPDAERIGFFRGGSCTLWHPSDLLIDQWSRVALPEDSFGAARQSCYHTRADRFPRRWSRARRRAGLLEWHVSRRNTPREIDLSEKFGLYTTSAAFERSSSPRAMCTMTSTHNKGSNFG